MSAPTPAPTVLIVVGASQVAAGLLDRSVGLFKLVVSANDMEEMSSRMPELERRQIRECAFVFGDRQPELVSGSRKALEGGGRVVGLSDDRHWFPPEVAVLPASASPEQILEALGVPSTGDGGAGAGQEGGDPIWDAELNEPRPTPASVPVAPPEPELEAFEQDPQPDPQPPVDDQAEGHSGTVVVDLAAESDDMPIWMIGGRIFNSYDPRGLDASGRHGKMIVVAGPKGGIGKTTMSLFLAEQIGLALEGTGRRVCHLDANVGQADGAPFLEGHFSPVGVRTITTLAKNEHIPNIGLIVTKLSGLHFDALLGPKPSVEVARKEITPSTYIDASKMLLTEYDYVVVDTQVAEYGDQMFSFFLLPNLDRLVCIVPQIPPVVDRTKVWLSSISDPVFTHDNQVANEKIGLLLNGFDPKGPFGTADVVKVMPHWTILDTIPWTKTLPDALQRRDLMSARHSVESHLRKIAEQLAPDAFDTPTARKATRKHWWQR